MFNMVPTVISEMVYHISFISHKNERVILYMVRILYNLTVRM